MTEQSKKAEQFASLHVQGDPLILLNIWDAGTANMVQKAGAKAIATSSLAVALSHGYEDGEKLPFDLVVANTRRIASVVDLPLTVDIEGGYATDPAGLRQSIIQIIDAGAIGINFEDQVIGDDGLYTIQEQCERILAIRQVADEMSMPLFINARTDIFLKLDPNEHNQQRHIEEAITRARAYAQAGANGFFVPGLQYTPYIRELCQQIDLPLNLMFRPDALSLKEMVALGVARVSYGPYPYFELMNTLSSQWSEKQ